MLYEDRERHLLIGDGFYLYLTEDPIYETKWTLDGLMTVARVWQINGVHTFVRLSVTSEHYSVLATTAFHIKGMRDHAFDSSHLIRWFAGYVINYTPISTSTRVWHVKGASRGPTPQPGFEPRTFNVIDERSTTVPTAARLTNGIRLKQLLQLQATQALENLSNSLLLRHHGFVA